MAGTLFAAAHAGVAGARAAAAPRAREVVRNSRRVRRKGFMWTVELCRIFSKGLLHRTPLNNCGFMKLNKINVSLFRRTAFSLRCHCER
jgi:hypothetical protein